MRLLRPTITPLFRILLAILPMSGFCGGAPTGLQGAALASRVRDEHFVGAEDRETVVSTELFELRVADAGDRKVVRTVAHSALEWAIAKSGLRLHSLPLIEVYPTTATFRDVTGEPGWVAASTHHQRMRLQPLSVLREKLAAVVRHEFLHMLVEDNAEPHTPLWFREGLVVYWGEDSDPAASVTMSGKDIDQAISSRHSETEMREAYAQAAALVREIELQKGHSVLIDWLRGGLPQDARGGLILPGAHVVAH